MSITITARASRFLRSSSSRLVSALGVSALAVASLAPTNAYALIDLGTTIDLPGNPNGTNNSPGSQGQIINIWCTSSEPCGQSSGTTKDGTIFAASPNPTQPSTGTGVFQPFLREQRGSGTCGVVDSTGNNGCITVNGNSTVGVEAAFNSDEKGGGATPINFDAKQPKWTHSVKMSDMLVTTYNNVQYLVLSLDANQLGQAQTDQNKIVLSQMEIFIGPGLGDPEQTGGGIANTGYAGTQYDNGTPQNDTLLGLSPRWSLDNNNNKDVDVVLQASICDTNGQCGSGKGDLDVFIPLSNLGAFSPTDNFVLYAEFLYANDGFEEWQFAPGSNCCSFVLPTPEPGTLALFGFGVAGLGLMRRRKKERNLARA